MRPLIASARALAARLPAPARTGFARTGFTRAGIAACLCTATVALAPQAALAQQPEASVWLDVIELGRNEFDLQLAAGVLASSEGNPEDAIRAFQAASAASPDRREALLLELRERLRIDQHAEVIALTDEVAASADSSLDAARLLFFRSISLAATGRYLEGAALLERAARYRSDLPDADLFYGNLAELHLAAGDLERAVLFFRRALSDAHAPAYRVGLAIALEQLGQTADAEAQMLLAFVADPDGQFLEEPGVFFAPDGQVNAYRALLAIAQGDFASAQRSLDAFDASDAAAVARPGFTDQLRARAERPAAHVQVVSFPGCVPLDIAVSENRERMAVRCEYGGVRERAIDGSDSVAQVGTGDDYSQDYTSVDIAYADNDQVRLLHSNGRVEAFERQSDRLVRVAEHNFDEPNLTPASFLAGGDRVLATGASSGGFQVFAWDAAGVQAQVTYPVNQTWVYMPAMSDTETTLVWLDGNQLRILAAPSWAPQGLMTIRYTDSRFMPWALTPSGQRIALVSDGLLLVHATATQSPIAVAQLSGIRTRIVEDPYVGVSAIEAMDDTTYAVGTTGEVHIATIPTSR